VLHWAPFSNTYCELRTTTLTSKYYLRRVDMPQHNKYSELHCDIEVSISTGTFISTTSEVCWVPPIDGLTKFCPGEKLITGWWSPPAMISQTKIHFKNSLAATSLTTSLSRFNSRICGRRWKVRWEKGENKKGVRTRDEEMGPEQVLGKIDNPAMTTVPKRVAWTLV